MAVGKGIMGNSTPNHEPKQQDSTRVKAGLQKLREAMIHDAKLESSRGSCLPKDWRSRLVK